MQLALQKLIKKKQGEGKTAGVDLIRMSAIYDKPIGEAATESIE
nr:MAG TPA: hypothetical protein [Caudoviricetes sp.]